jgi:hypothetical protein
MAFKGSSTVRLKWGEIRAATVDGLAPIGLESVRDIIDLDAKDIRRK